MDSCRHHQVGTDVALTVTFGRQLLPLVCHLLLGWLSYRLTLQGNSQSLAMAMLVAQSRCGGPVTCGNPDGKVTFSHL